MKNRARLRARETGPWIRPGEHLFVLLQPSGSTYGATWWKPQVLRLTRRTLMGAAREVDARIQDATCCDADQGAQLPTGPAPGWNFDVNPDTALSSAASIFTAWAAWVTGAAGVPVHIWPQGWLACGIRLDRELRVGRGPMPGRAVLLLAMVVLCWTPGAVGANPSKTQGLDVPIEVPGEETRPTGYSMLRGACTGNAHAPSGHVLRLTVWVIGGGEGIGFEMELTRTEGGPPLLSGGWTQRSAREVDQMVDGHRVSGRCDLVPQAIVCTQMSVAGMALDTEFREITLRCGEP